MWFLPKFLGGLKALFQKDQVERDMDDELRGYLDSAVQEKMRSGMSYEEALRSARVEIGSIDSVKEGIRSAGWEFAVETLWQDLRYGARMLRRNPGFIAIAVLTLALGIGGTVVVFGLLEAVLLRPLPYSQPDRLFYISTVEAESRRAMVSSSYPDFRDWQRQSRTFEAMAAFEEQPFNLTGTAEPERLPGVAITPGLFSTLGIRPVLGREFTRDDDEHVAVLSYELWQRRFGGDGRIIGKPIHLEGRAYAVLGVLPPHFRFPPHRWGGVPGVFVPVIPNPDRSWFYMRVFGRLAAETTEQQARVEMNGIAARLAQAYPESGKKGISLDPLGHYAVSDVRQTARLLFGAVAFVLLIACANVANLLLSQGAAREREMAIRTAVGATRPRMLRQLLTESLLLAALGGAIGLALAYWTLPLIAIVAPPHTSFFTRIQDAGIHLNSTVLIFSVLTSALSSILFGILPAWRATKPARSSVSSVRPGSMRGALIALEVALSFVLLVGAGLMMRSLTRLLEVDVGFRTQRLLTMGVSLSEEKYREAEKQTAYFDQVLQRLTILPGVQSVASITDLPLTRSWTRNGFEIPGPPPRKGSAGYHSISTDYFRTMGIPLLNGRELGMADSARSPLVGVINRSMASKYWPNENPIGKSIVIYRAVAERTTEGEHVRFKPHTLEIVGIVGDVRQLGLDAPPDPELFVPYAQRPLNEMSLVLRTASGPSSLIPLVKKEIWRVDPDQPVTDVKTMNELVATDAAGRRFVLQLIGTFALIAVLLAGVGIYGVASYWMRQRTHEIGIRMALGARGHQIVGLVVRQNVGWLLIGIAVGIASALGLTRLLAAYLYAVRPTDTSTFVLVVVAQLAIAGLAGYIPAHRATKVDPMVALRHE